MSETPIDNRLLLFPLPGFNSIPASDAPALRSAPEASINRPMHHAPALCLDADILNAQPDRKHDLQHLAVP